MIVLDTSFLVGFFNERDAHHTQASVLMRDFLDGRWGKGLLLEYVFLERDCHNGAEADRRPGAYL